MTKVKRGKKKMSECPHVLQCNEHLSRQLIASRAKSKCRACHMYQGELWLCAVCIQCYANHGTDSTDHILIHYKYSHHSVAINLAGRRFWCFACECEVFDGNNTPEFRVKKEGSIPVDWDSINGVPVLETPLKGLVGLKNLGNTCYMNSALQCLSNCHPMTTYFMNFMEIDESRAPLSTAYKELMLGMWAEGRPHVCVPSDLLGIIKHVNPSFRGYMQQDTQELLRCVIDRLHEELKHVVTFDPPLHLSPASDSGTQSVRYTSVIADLFNGLIRSSVRCLHCDKVSVTTEEFQDLSLPIPCGDQLSRLHSKADTSAQVSESVSSGNDWSYFTWVTSPFSYLYDLWSRWQTDSVTLDDCFSAFFSPDDLSGDNMYSCENCKKLRNGLKEVSILHLPEVMCIHLKRFRHDLMHSSKIGSHVSFPITGLDVSPYIKHGALRGDTSSSLYNLTGVICHHGSVAGGHYTAYALHPATNIWYEYDDSYVTKVSVETVKQCQGYVLFYTRDSSKRKISNQKLLTRLRQVKPGLLQFYISKLWLFKLFTCADPGPITNSSDYVCVHGAIRPTEYENIEEKLVALSDTDWGYLHNKYGGGPAINSLVKCQTCQTTLDAVHERQLREKETFHVKNKKRSSRHYAISMTWFRKWEQFIDGKTTTPPGPIDNKSIVMEKPGLRKEKHTLRKRADYGTLKGPLWRFLHGIYGGGPEVIYSCLQNAEVSDDEIHGEMVQASSSDSVTTSPVQSEDSLTSDHSSSTSLHQSEERTPVKVFSSQSEQIISQSGARSLQSSKSKSATLMVHTDQSKSDTKVDHQSDSNVPVLSHSKVEITQSETETSQSQTATVVSPLISKSKSDGRISDQSPTSMSAKGSKSLGHVSDQSTVTSHTNNQPQLTTKASSQQMDAVQINSETDDRNHANKPLVGLSQSETQIESSSRSPSAQLSKSESSINQQ